uniref:DUF1741 domain-containing protein n=1 Tax=Ascaris lumbricoides TaxID=6252 RepID=A0A0M3I237_ASCLU
MEKGIPKLAYFINTLFVDEQTEAIDWMQLFTLRYSSELLISTFTREQTEAIDWMQLFTLRYSSELLISTFTRVENDLYTKKKPLVRLYLIKSVDIFSTESGIRVFNAAQAICDLIEHLSPRISQRTDTFVFLLGDETDNVVKRLAERCASLVVESCKLRKLALHLMICLLSTGHVSSLIDNLLLTNIYESIFSVIGDNELCFADGSAALLLLTLLVGYRRPGITNCISEKLSAECNDSSLTVNSVTAHKYFMKHIATKLLKATIMLYTDGWSNVWEYIETMWLMEGSLCWDRW